MTEEALEPLPVARSVKDTSFERSMRCCRRESKTATINVSIREGHVSWKGGREKRRNGKGGKGLTKALVVAEHGNVGSALLWPSHQQ